MPARPTTMLRPSARSRKSPTLVNRSLVSRPRNIGSTTAATAMSTRPTVLTLVGDSSRRAVTAARPRFACPPRTSTQAIAKTARMMAPCTDRPPFFSKSASNSHSSWKPSEMSSSADSSDAVNTIVSAIASKSRLAIAESRWNAPPARPRPAEARIQKIAP